jgi:hypothetical protein
MKRFSQKIPAIILAVCWGIFAAPAGPSPLAAAESLLVRQDYNAARAAVAQHLQSAPDDSYALYLRVAIEQTELLDYESYSLHYERFLQAADSVRKVLEDRLRKLAGQDSTLCLFYIANIYGGISVIKAKTGSWFSALRSGLTSVNMLKEVAQRDSTIYAASLGIGIFHYYLSKSFKWLPFIDDDSEDKGIREIEKSTSAPSPYDFAAKNSLCWILIDRQQFSRADTIAGSVLREAPENSIFLRIRCLIALWSGNYNQAVALGEKLAQIAIKRTPINWSNLVLAYYVLSCGDEALGKGKEACAAADYILDNRIPPEFKKIPPIKKNLKKIAAVKKKCLSL